MLAVTRIPPTPRRTGLGRSAVNSTARWPERLEHAATLLRAEGAAVVSLRGGEFTTLFSYRLDGGLDWPSLLGADKLRAAVETDAPAAAAIPAGRWGDETAYAVMALIERADDAAACLCALRHRIPFDALETAGCRAAAKLLAAAIEDGRVVAAADRLATAQAIRRTVRDDLARTRDAAALARAAGHIAQSIDANGASIMLVDGEELRLRAAVGLPKAAFGHRQRIGEGIAGYVAQHGEALTLEGRVRDERFTGSDPRAGSALVIPLRVGERVLGVLNVKRTAGEGSFDEVERTVATELADEVARAVAPEPGPAGRPAEARTGGANLRVLAVEDHPLMRLGIAALLEREDVALVAISATSGEAVEHARQGGIDVALVDLGLPDAEGVDVIERLRAAAPDLPLVAFSVEGGADRVRAAVRAGAVGYLTKSAPGGRVVAALRAAAAGLSALGPEEAAALAQPHDAVEVVQKAVARSLPLSAEPAPPPPANGSRGVGKDALSARELELLRYLAEGYTNKEIARAMVLAEDTVKKGVQTLIAKLGATDRTHAVVLALRSELIQ